MGKTSINQFTGTKSPEVRDYERTHRLISRRAAAEGFVLLKNENQVLPLGKERPVALYGAGASRTVKGGTGSGDVNEREVVSIWEGMKKAGYNILTEDWLRDFDQTYEAAREAWRDEIWRKADNLKIDKSQCMFYAYSTTPFQMPSGGLPEKTDTDTAVYILSRVAGEGKDRTNGPGDYLLADREQEILEKICLMYKNVIVAVNAGGLVDLSFLDWYENIRALIQIVQPGMEAGNAFADVLSGKVTPCGKLTDSWAYDYMDYPNAETFSGNNGNTETEKYEEGIYVGYRYFDTFEIPVRYCFGYGLSYTDFSINTIETECVRDGGSLMFSVKVQVTNTGAVYAGKEVVQVYVSCPQEKLPKEYRRLAGFAKTRELGPGEMQELLIRFSIDQLTSYDESVPGWLLEKGVYGIFTGSSLEQAELTGAIEVPEEIVMTETEHICPVQRELCEIAPVPEKPVLRREAWLREMNEVPVIHVNRSDVVTGKITYGKSEVLISDEAKELTAKLTKEQCILLTTGDPSKAQESNLGSAGFSVPGSAAQTSGCAEDEGFRSIVLADGPAGLRLTKKYFVQGGEIVPQPFETNLEGGYLCRDQGEPEGLSMYQYCTSIPVGTLLAQTWDTNLVKEVGQMIAEEMKEFHVTLWLAPGMNIHRNPLCGRNFEYYSEDPLLTGVIAAAMTEGVQSCHECGTTIKHYACNNQEDNRMGSDSVLTERTLREIYLKGFEIAVKQAKPLSIMTSYNKINGIHAANSYDLCTKAARDEWGFTGVIMTDWTTTHYGPDCTASGCMRAGNDLVMPGCVGDHVNMRQELADGKLSMEEVRRSIMHLAEVVRRTK